MAQDAAIEALEHGSKDVESMRREYEHRRNYIVRAMNDLGLKCFQPLGAFYIFPDITSSGLSSRDFSLGLLNQKKVACVPGTAFGPSGEGFVRCCYATSLEQIKEAMNRIGEFLAEVKK
jgi:aminotransferase